MQPLDIQSVPGYSHLDSTPRSAVPIGRRGTVAAQRASERQGTRAFQQSADRPLWDGSQSADESGGSCGVWRLEA